MSEEYEYEKEMDFHYENSGANHSEMQHAKDCEWIYDNCTCGLIEYLDYNIPDDGDYQLYINFTVIKGVGSLEGCQSRPKVWQKKYCSHRREPLYKGSGVPF